MHNKNNNCSKCQLPTAQAKILDIWNDPNLQIHQLVKFPRGNSFFPKQMLYLLEYKKKILGLNLKYQITLTNTEQIIAYIYTDASKREENTGIGI